MSWGSKAKTAKKIANKINPNPTAGKKGVKSNRQAMWAAEKAAQKAALRGKR